MNYNFLYQSIFLLSLVSLLSRIFAVEPTNTLEKAILYAPWRNAYNKKLLKKDLPNEACPFCHELSQDADKHNMILARFKHLAVFLNRFPYSYGHLLIIPYNHVRSLEELTQEARIELMEIITQSINIIKETINPEGCNLGINFERAAGASIPDHLHVQIVPRWFVDNNYMFITGNTSVVQWDMQELYTLLCKAFNSI